MEFSSVIVIIVIFSIFLCIMCGIGVFYSKKNKSTNEYFIGGRKNNAFVTAMATEASDISGWTFLSLPGIAYALGLSAAGWLAIGLALGTYLSWRLVAKRIRIYTKKANDSITLPEFFKNRFADKKKILSSIAAIVIIGFFVISVAAQFTAFGKLFHSVFGLDYTLAIVIGAAIVVAYTFIGGFKAVCMTDTIQAVIVILALVLVPIVSIFFIIGNGMPIQMPDPLMFSMFHEYNPATQAFEFVSVFTIVSAISWAFGYFGQPHVIPKFMGIKNPSEVPRARRLAMVWLIIVFISSISIGFIGQLLFGSSILDRETVFMETASTLFGFAPVLLGVIYCGILGAIMSTASSLLLVSASSFSKDLFKNLFHMRASDRLVLIISKISVIVVAVIAFLISMNPDSSVFSIMSISWAGLGASFGTVILGALYWKRMNWQGALAGILGGTITTALWYFIAEGIFQSPIYEMIPAVIVSFLCIFIVTKLTSPPDKSITDTFEEYQNELTTEKN